MIGKRRVSRKGRMESGGITQTKVNTKRGERNYTDEALALLNHLKPLMNLWRALMSALDTEFKLSQSPTPPHRNIHCNSPAGICSTQSPDI